MTRATRELLLRGLHAQRRAALGWGIGIAALTLTTVAFWPSLEGTDALSQLADTGGGFLEAFGAQNIATPAGYLDGQLYALMLPGLLSGFAVVATTSLTSGDEDGGRLELLHALPVSRPAVWLSRLAAVLAVLAGLAAVVSVSVVASRPVFSLEEVTPGRIVAATAACGLLGAFHAAVAYAAGGAGRSRGSAAGLAVLVLVAGYVAAFLFPLSEVLAPLRRLSPWYWAIGAQPVSDGVSPAWLAVLVAASAGLVAAGTAALTRRDIRNA